VRCALTRNDLHNLSTEPKIGDAIDETRAELRLAELPAHTGNTSSGATNVRGAPSTQLVQRLTAEPGGRPADEEIAALFATRMIHGARKRE
jgi:hypothetical protein